MAARFLAVRFGPVRDPDMTTPLAGMLVFQLSYDHGVILSGVSAHACRES